MTETDEIDVEALGRTVLAGQEEPKNLAVPTVAHWAECFDRRAPLSRQDKAYLAISPLSRARYALAQGQHRTIFVERAANRNNRPVLQAAASSTARQRIRFAPMNDFTIAIEPSGPTGWLIICDVRAGFRRGSLIELVDREGTVWLSGSPNEDGRIVARHESMENPLKNREPFTIRVDGTDLI